MSWARIYSDLFNPLIMNVVVVIVSAFLSGVDFEEIIFTGIAAAGLIGVLPYWYLRRQINRKVIDDVDVKEKLQRLRPLAFTISSFLIFAGLLAIWQPGEDHFLLFIVLSYAVCAILAAIITRFWKISLHNACFTAVWAIVLIQLWLISASEFYIYLFSILALLSIVLMGAARVKLRVHTVGQVIGGVLFGLILPVLLFYLFIFP